MVRMCRNVNSQHQPGASSQQPRQEDAPHHQQGTPEPPDTGLQQEALHLASPGADGADAVTSEVVCQLQHQDTEDTTAPAEVTTSGQQKLQGIPEKDRQVTQTAQFKQPPSMGPGIQKVMNDAVQEGDVCLPRAQMTLDDQLPHPKPPPAQFKPPAQWAPSAAWPTAQSLPQGSNEPKYKWAQKAQSPTYKSPPPLARNVGMGKQTPENQTWNEGTTWTWQQGKKSMPKTRGIPTSTTSAHEPRGYKYEHPEAANDPWASWAQKEQSQKGWQGDSMPQAQGGGTKQHSRQLESPKERTLESPAQLEQEAKVQQGASESPDGATTCTFDATVGNKEGVQVAQPASPPPADVRGGTWPKADENQQKKDQEQHHEDSWTSSFVAWFW